MSQQGCQQTNKNSTIIWFSNYIPTGWSVARWHLQALPRIHMFPCQYFWNTHIPHANISETHMFPCQYFWKYTCSHADAAENTHVPMPIFLKIHMFPCRYFWNTHLIHRKTFMNFFSFFFLLCMQPPFTTVSFHSVSVIRFFILIR